MALHEIFLSDEDLELLSDIFHEYKDGRRGEPEFIRPVMDLEKDLAIQTGGLYQADTTYDIKD